MDDSRNSASVVNHVRTLMPRLALISNFRDKWTKAARVGMAQPNCVADKSLTLHATVMNFSETLIQCPALNRCAAFVSPICVRLAQHLVSLKLDVSKNMIIKHVVSTSIHKLSRGSMCPGVRNRNWCGNEIVEQHFAICTTCGKVFDSGCYNTSIFSSRVNLLRNDKCYRPVYWKLLCAWILFFFLPLACYSFQHDRL